MCIYVKLLFKQGGVALDEVEEAEVVAEIGHVDGLVGVEHPVEIVGISAF